MDIIYSARQGVGSSSKTFIGSEEPSAPQRRKGIFIYPLLSQTKVWAALQRHLFNKLVSDEPLASQKRKGISVYHLLSQTKVWGALQRHLFNEIVSEEPSAPQKHKGIFVYYLLN